jgi:hypothetical protein
VYDSGADVTLCSEEFAKKNKLTYGGSPIPIHTADGSHNTTLGELDSPLEFILAKDTPYACSAVAPVQVVRGAGHLYDLIVSMEIICQWSGHIDLSSHDLVYRPHYWLGDGDGELQAALPMYLRTKLPFPSTKTKRLARPQQQQRNERAAQHSAPAG